jgi:lipopolysaccharide transport system ATP-binding protein
MQPVVTFEHVWKKFRRGERHDSLRDLIPAVARRLVRRRREIEQTEFWALRDVTFSVAPGEALGIIGPNGAGKSTTLKLLTRILKPTRGHCAVRGRIGALIEVAAGFHPDLTGRENIYLQGAIMGMRQAEITNRLDQIIDFAGVNEFIDTPVKRYSSGMHARLGFSVAAHLDPDVLLIDEVLSVGDMAFQQRCIERMEAFKRDGVTIIFISHNLQAVRNLCETALYLHGSVQALGPAPDVIQHYIQGTSGDRAAPTDAAVQVEEAQLLDTGGRPAAVVAPGSPLTLRVTYAARAAITDLTLGFLTYRSIDGLVVYSDNVRGEEIGLHSLSPGEQVVVDFAFRAHLTRGQYHLECHAFHNPTQRHLSRLCPAGIFTVNETHTHGGIADLELRPTLVARALPRLNHVTPATSVLAADQWLTVEIA